MGNRNYAIKITESFCTDSRQPTKVYGILLSRNGKTYEISDISSNKSFVINLIRICRSHLVLPEHLMDVVEDYLAKHL